MRDYASYLPVLLDADLLHAGWNGTINPYPGMTSELFAMQSLRRSLLKKFEDAPSETADSKALSLFLKINQGCKDFIFKDDQQTELEFTAFGEAREFIYRASYHDDQSGVGPLTTLNLHYITESFGLGNGANIGSFSTDFLSKVGTSTMAATDSSLHFWFKEAIRVDPIWSDVESIRSENRETEIVRGSRLSFVPKTTEISRTICTEPICNMLFQKGIADVLTKRLREISGINLSTQQSKNRQLARLGSLTGEFGTIDLSSASDSMSLSLVREFFPRHMVSWLEKTRSPVTTLPGGTEVELHMVSSMGNAYTFPLQTIFFCALVYGAYRALDIRIKRPGSQSLGNFAVNGDDIIVDKRAYRLVCDMLIRCGFSVNVDKSFNEGLFRESCGGDYYHGYNVRGVYIKSLRTISDRYSAINRLNFWSARHGILLQRTIQYLLGGLRFLPVPLDEMDTAGIKVPFRSLKRILLSKHTGAVFYRYLHIEERSTSVRDVESRPPNIRGWFHNPSAVLLAALAGTVRAGKIVTRSSRQSTRIRSRYCPNWDFTVADLGVNRGFGGYWKVSFELNLNLS
jgi:hypothetical protein